MPRRHSSAEGRSVFSRPRHASVISCKRDETISIVRRRSAACLGEDRRGERSFVVIVVPILTLEVCGVVEDSEGKENNDVSPPRTVAGPTKRSKLLDKKPT